MQPNARRIVIYTHRGCWGGERAIAYFLEKQIPVQVKDILNDPQARAEFAQQRHFATPIIVIDDEAMVGFDEEQMEARLRAF